MKETISKEDMNFIKDACFFFVKENYPDATVDDVFVSLTDEHREILSKRYFAN